jgi:membrane associated rhomboid family serine protease/antitoxin component YwqK of YwqJK toxin-antitoxin module
MMKKSISTFALIALNVLVFGWLALQQKSLMMDRNIDVLAIIRAGANLNPLTLGGESWRMISAMFLHFGVLHLAANMFGLFSLGSSLEPRIGTLRFLLIYFICGVAASLASLLFNVYVPSAGASGAIFGLFGFSLGVEIIENFRDKARLGSVAINFIIFVAINAFISSQVNVDMAGHIGGAVTGLVLALLLHAFSSLGHYSSLSIILVLLFSFVFVLPRGQVEYYKLFQRVVSTDDKTNALFKNVKEDYPLMDSLKAIILPRWDSLSLEFKNISNVPEEVTSDTTIVGQYIKFRKAQTLYRIYLIERESYTYFDSLEIVDRQIDSLPSIKFVLNYKAPDDAVVADDTTQTQPPPSSYQPARVFYDAHWNEIDNASLAHYYRVGSKDSLGRWQGFVRDYYISGNVQMKGKYTDDLKDGVFLYYSDRKTYESAGRYEKESNVGKWERFHWNGSLQSEVFYNNGVFVRNAWDSLGNQQVTSGEGKFVDWHANGKVREEGLIKKGKRHDFWHGYYEDGRPHYEELYQSNRLVRGVSLDEAGKRYAYDESSDFPFPNGGLRNFNEYVRKNINSQVADGKSGVVKILFYVDEQGVLSDFTVLEGLCTACNEEAIRLIKSGPKWHPALLHGHTKIKSQGYAEILF